MENYIKYRLYREKQEGYIPVYFRLNEVLAQDIIDKKIDFCINFHDFSKIF